MNKIILIIMLILATATNALSAAWITINNPTSCMEYYDENTGNEGLYFCQSSISNPFGCQYNWIQISDLDMAKIAASFAFAADNNGSAISIYVTGCSAAGNIVGDIVKYGN